MSQVSWDTVIRNEDIWFYVDGNGAIVTLTESDEDFDIPHYPFVVVTVNAFSEIIGTALIDFFSDRIRCFSDNGTDIVPLKKYQEDGLFSLTDHYDNGMITCYPNPTPRELPAKVLDYILWNEAMRRFGDAV